MEKNCFLEKLLNFLKCYSIIFVAFLVLVINSCKNENKLKIAISPYQDIAMIVNIKNLKLEEKYNIRVDLQTMNWEEILPAVASAGRTVDVGFGSLTEYLTKYENLNKDSKDSILFIYPAYIFKGGGFITFNDAVPELDNSTVINDTLVKHFCGFKIGAQKNSIYEMMLFSLAKRNRIDIKSLKVFDTPLNDGILAAENGSLDIASAGLTQISEALKNNGRLVLNMERLGFADITGFICKKSTLEKRKNEIESLIKMWFESVAYVFEDIEKNSKYSMQYLDKKAATKYTLEQYKTALSQEFFPKSLTETENTIISDKGLFSYQRISSDIIEYLFTNRIISKKPTIPQFIQVQ
jgi:hypothetical protein